MFTPQQNFSCEHYAGDNWIYRLDHPGKRRHLDLYLASDVNNTNPGSPIHEPGPDLASATARISYSTGPLYSFDLSASLQADTSYWLWIYLQSPDGNDYVRLPGTALMPFKALQRQTPLMKGGEGGGGGSGDRR